MGMTKTLGNIINMHGNGDKYIAAITPLDNSCSESDYIYTLTLDAVKGDSHVRSYTVIKMLSKVGKAGIDWYIPSMLPDVYFNKEVYTIKFKDKKLMQLAQLLK
jgi:hypothetical protein